MKNADITEESLQAMSGGFPEEAFAITEQPSDATRQAIREAVHADLQPVEAVSMKKRALFVLGIGVASAMLAVISYGGAGLQGLAKHAASTVVTAVVALLATLAIAGSFTPTLQAKLGRSHRGLVLASLVVAWTVYLASNITDQALGTALAGPAIGCCLRSLLSGLLGCSAFLYIFRRTDPWTPRISGALLGACAGTIASAGVGIPCPSETGGHLMVGHWLAVPLVALFGALAARRVLEP